MSIFLSIELIKEIETRFRANGRASQSNLGLK
jgi:hypothetical protein